MTISQRLTRGSLTFLLLGTVAAVLPENINALADTVNCSGGPSTQYRLTDQADGTDNSATTIRAGARIFLYTFISADSGQTFQRDPFIPVALTTSTPPPVVRLASATTDANGQVRGDSVARGSGIVTATFTDTAGVQENAAFQVTVH